MQGSALMNRDAAISVPTTVHIYHQSNVEPTNKRDERAMRSHAVLIKILGTQRNDKVTLIHERTLTISKF